ncbi:glycosyltransferase family 4 protein [Armatimonas sp.]|uniref:glycosyltransferase family 4 protein n=1 Tax=Armatimonas sp. TaxID=1872638 RepID=UPI0037525398
MRLLIVSPWFPYPPDNGSRLRAWHLIQRLAERHEVRLIVGRQEDASSGEIPLKIPTTIVPWLWHQPGATGKSGALQALLSATPRSILETSNPAFVEAIARELALKPDVVLAMELGSDAYLPEQLPCPIFLDQVEVSGLEQAWRQAATPRERTARWLTYTKGKRYWSRRLRRYHGLTAVSEAEARAVEALTGKPVTLVANGVATKEYSPREKPAGVPGRLLYNGALSYGPNRDAVLWFVEAILPKITERIPEAHLVVTGNADAAPEALRQHPQVVLTGFVAQLQPVLADAQVCVVPLRAGGGTRLKILEAWAAGLPVVATTIGAAGLDGSTDGEHLLMADTPTRFAQQTAALLRDPEKRRALAQSARTLAEARYDWDAIVLKLEECLHQRKS